MDKAEEKKILRRLIRSRKAEMSEEQKLSAATMISSRIESLPEFAEAWTVLAYCALPDEVATAGFIARWCGHKRIVLPVVKGDALELRLYDPSKLRPGYKGILEPSDDAEVIDPADIDLAIIPGMAFDSSGHRLGRGGGFYDRLIPQLHCPLVGICFSCQLVPDVPVEPFDRTLDIVISEND